MKNHVKGRWNKMRLIIDKYGTYIHKKKNRFIILDQSQDNEFSVVSYKS